MKTGLLNNVSLPILFNAVNDIVQHGHTGSDSYSTILHRSILLIIMNNAGNKPLFIILQAQNCLMCTIRFVIDVYALPKFTHVGLT